MNSESNWEVIYEIAEDPGDFFQNYSLDVKRVFEDDRDLPPGFFIDGLERLKNMDNPQSRGREFDYFIGILFQQLNEVEVRVKEHGNTGEVDLHLICLDSDDWLYRLVGSHTLVENKWEKDPIQKGEISNFHDKASELPQCEISYFVSMSGFSRGQRKQTGALANLRNLRNPQIVDIWDDDLEEMVSKGTPEPLLRDRIMM
ncbi:restriction endonuclease [Natrinema limicola]|uniref:Restriction endonuclease type IV Mrr domain-containing protein n=1 Tax=Natrinema limicola JCM 13563 TaxID=1230457 RepID=M0BY79_9EURY|nr:restriction endonuclease [Natrinema limicola]ELZ15986.1 hypothetical protein C476_17262 [Natrinema limicola JCM 13563]